VALFSIDGATSAGATLILPHQESQIQVYNKVNKRENINFINNTG